MELSCIETTKYSVLQSSSHCFYHSSLFKNCTSGGNEGLCAAKFSLRYHFSFFGTAVIRVGDEVSRRQGRVKRRQSW